MNWNYVAHIIRDVFPQRVFTTLYGRSKELLDVLYEKNLKGEMMTTQMINKIIGVQQKDIMTQNKNRSDHFLKINLCLHDAIIYI